MPSPSRPRTRLELLAAFGVVGAAALGAIVLIWRPHQLSHGLAPRQLRLPWVQATETRGEDLSNRLSLPLMGQRNRRKTSSPMTVPPPVVPQILPPESLYTKALEFPSQTSAFTDLPISHWAYPMVSELASREVVSGFLDKSFRPEQPMTRAEFASQVARAFDLSLVHDVQSFRDIAADNWAAKDIQSAIQMGFLTGYPDAMFLPDQTISRIQVLTALAQGLHLKTSSGSKVILRYYHDYDQVPDWAVRPLVAATEAGLVVNHPDLARLNPNRPATRAEVAAMLYRALIYIGYLEDVTSPHWVQPGPMPQM